MQNKSHKIVIKGSLNKMRSNDTKATNLILKCYKFSPLLNSKNEVNKSLQKRYFTSKKYL